MKYVDKIIFRDKETYNKLYKGSELLFQTKVVEELNYDDFSVYKNGCDAYIRYYYYTNTYDSNGNIISSIKNRHHYRNVYSPYLQFDGKSYFEGSQSKGYPVSVTGNFMTTELMNNRREERTVYSGFVKVIGKYRELRNNIDYVWDLIDGNYTYQYENSYKYKFDSYALNKKIRFHTSIEIPFVESTVITNNLNLCGSTDDKVLGIPDENTTGKFIIGENFIGKIYTIFSSGVSFIDKETDSYYTFIPSPNGKIRVKGENSDGTIVNELISPIGSGNITYGYESYEDINEKYKEYDALYVSGRYEFKIPKGDGRYYIIFSRNDCEADIITDKDFTSLNQTIISSTSKPDDNEWELFFNGSNLYFDICKILNKRLEWKFGTIKKDTVYTIGGSNGNYLGTDRAIYVNGSKKVYSKETSVWDNDSDIIKIGENVTNVYVGNIKIYESTGLMYNIVPIMYNGNVAFYDKVNKRFMEIVSTPPSEYAKTRLTGEIIEIIY